MNSRQRRRLPYIDWFAPANPMSLCMARAVYFGAVFVHFLPRSFAGWAEVSPAFWMPIGIFAHFHLPVLPAGALVALGIVWKAALALACIGLFTRPAAAVSAVLGFYLLGLGHSFGKTDHDDALVVLVCLVMAFARCGDVFSVDARLDAARRARRGDEPSYYEASPEYGWPIKTVQLLLALAFFAAGVAKLRRSGLAWVFSDSFRNLLIESFYETPSRLPATDWGRALAQHGWVCQALAAGALMIELLYPLALISRRARLVLVPGAIVMQLGIRALVGPTFTAFLLTNLFWVPWRAVARAVARAGRVAALIVTGAANTATARWRARPPGPRVAFIGSERRAFSEMPRMNPTASQLARALAGIGVTLEPAAVSDFGALWVWACHRRYAAIHLNWLHLFYTGGSSRGRRRRYARMVRGLRAAKKLGVRIVWTMHNLYPHERHDPALDEECRRFVCEQADAVIVPCHRAAALLDRHFARRGGIVHVPRGHLIGLYPNTIDRAAARLELGFPEAAFVYLSFGVLRPYKGTVGLVEAFRSLPDAALRLLIAGKVSSTFPEIGREIEEACRGESRATFRPGRVPAGRIQVLMNAADAVVLPFEEVLNSASAILALSFGRPVVAPAIGCLPELLAGRACAALYDPEAPAGLARALVQVRGIDPVTASAAAFERARELDWGEVARRHAFAYGLSAPEPGSTYSDGRAGCGAGGRN